MEEIPGATVAGDLARRLLGPLGTRYDHTSQVARRATELAPAVPPEDQDLLVDAAWWHDLGSAPELVRTGFSPIDGARYLAAEGHSPRLCALVAHHSAASYEAEERGLSEMLAQWPREEGPVPDALWMADMTSGPEGQSVGYAERLAEILDRYGADSVVGRATSRAEPDIVAAIERTKERLTVRRPSRSPNRWRR